MICIRFFITLVIICNGKNLATCCKVFDDSRTLQHVARFFKTIAPSITNLALSWKTFSSYFIKPYYGPSDGDANGATQNGDTGRPPSPVQTCVISMFEPNSVELKFVVVWNGSLSLSPAMKLKLSR